MEFDKINAFLATAIGGIIFKWLAGGVSSFWLWLNKSHPDEDFLVSKISIAKPLIRLSLCKYKQSTKPYTKHNKIFLAIFGSVVIVISIIGLYQFTNIVQQGPIQWIDYKHKETNDSFWIKVNEAKNKPNKPEWNISPDICLDSKSLAKITFIKQATKDFICSYMLDPKKKEALNKAANKNALGLMVLIPIAYLTLLFFFMLGSAMFIDLYINKKITKFNNSEIERSYQYLT
ncbi:DUF6216 family protein [Enterobacter cloacae]|jgi:hypothetical protein|uniref:DUF6216 family protein n=1 Tax=Enterobacter cloacae TaxID=550 RepID=UPI0005797DF7|nr:DUF6216 family protein [Enterobacter cloacae]MCM7396289.1 DUF6216 family protein [Enterobacter cloacae]MDS0065110.1 DUF6216 family protein [Enterobacter cloacae subsp. cloacae]MDS0107769.1 DUF6216 family protein [Enterobacter cloacae subsp. cloacae]MDW8496717.1 DUF6216 family protein [Enterobacter cloacae subsp. cloacae]QGN41968.1 hypothetical protein GJ694_07115 [Enterobacter cloacae]